MANVIKVKRSAVAGKIPATTDLQLGELAINTFDGKLFIKKNDGTESIVELGTGGGGGGGASVTVSSTAPTTANSGDLWWDSDDGILKIYYQDENSSQWVDASYNAYSDYVTELEYIQSTFASLQNEITVKASLNSPTFTGDVVLPATTTIGSVTSTELGYLDGVTSAIQSQLNGKVGSDSPTFTGTVVLPSTTSIGTVSSTELGYLDGVTSAVQTQLNSKVGSDSPTFTGTVVLPSTTSIGTVSSTELGYIDGVTSAVQTQLNAKANSASPTFTGSLTSDNLADAVGYKGIPQNSQSSSYTLALSDIGKHIDITTGGVVIPANGSVAFPIGSTIVIFNDSASTQAISITTDTLRQAGTANVGTRTLAAYGLATVLKVASTVWVVSGNVT